MREVATFDPWSVSVEDELFEAMILMLRHRIHRVVVRDGDAVVGLLGQLELMAFVASHSHLIALQAAEAADLAELRAAAQQIDGLIRVLHQDGVRIDVIAGLVGELNRKVFARLWELLAPAGAARQQLPDRDGQRGARRADHQDRPGQRAAAARRLRRRRDRRRSPRRSPPR